MIALADTAYLPDNLHPLRRHAWHNADTGLIWWLDDTGRVWSCQDDTSDAPELADSVDLGYVVYLAARLGSLGVPRIPLAEVDGLILGLLRNDLVAELEQDDDAQRSERYARRQAAAFPYLDLMVSVLRRLSEWEVLREEYDGPLLRALRSVVALVRDREEASAEQPTTRDA